MQTQSLDLRRRRDIGGMVTLTFDFLRLNFRPLARAVLMIAGPPIALLAVASGVLFADMLDMSQFDPNAPGDFAPFVGLMTKFGATIGFSLLVGIVLTAVVTAYVVLYVERNGDGEIEVAEVREKFFSYIGMAIVTSFVTSLLTGLGFVFLIIPGIYLAIALAFTFTIRAVEGEGLFDAIKRSTSLVSGHWWMTFGLLIVMSIINAVIGMIFAVPQYIVSALYGITMAEGEAPGSGLRLAMVITTIIQTFGSHLLNTVLVLSIVLQYFNLVEIKEGVGAMRRLDEIGAGRDVDPY